MTENQHQRMGEEGEQLRAAPKETPDNIPRSKMEMDERDAEMVDIIVSRRATEVVRRMRWYAVVFAIMLPYVLPMTLFFIIKVAVIGMTDDVAVEVIKTSLTVLIIGAFVSATSVYCAVIFGLFRSESREKESWAQMHPLVSGSKEILKD